MKILFTIILLFYFSNDSLSQQTEPTGGGEFHIERESNCLSDEKRQEIKLMLERNVANLEKRGIIKPSKERINFNVAFEWPLQKTNGLSFNSYYATNNFVDQSDGGLFLDYNCFDRTYNGHQGTDIDTWPFPWYIYDNDFVEVIAGEEGVIVGKTDGNDDDHCSCSGNWNAVFVEHSDGSTAWYGHLKKNSLTTKSIGQTVAKGEYLGIVASSGCSTQPHLHFEVYDDSDNLIDPYSGSCNGLNSSSWWVTQPQYRESTLNALLTHDAVPVHGCPGGNEEPNLSNVFVSGQTIYMATYYHDQLVGDASTHIIRRPDNSIWTSWTHTSNGTFTKSWWYWNWVLPNNGPFGDWTFEVEYDGQTYQHQFQYLSDLPVELTSFNARKKDANSIILNWETASETNNWGFEVQKSLTGNNWEKLSFIEGYGTVQQTQFYSHLDRNPSNGLNYYRLKQIDFDGKEEYSDVISIDMEKASTISIFPNPINDLIYINGDSKKVEINIYDSLGRIILNVKNTDVINVSDLANGVYFISVETKKQNVIKRIVKN